MIDTDGPSVCVVDPGYEVDVTIRADVESLYKVWLGRTPIKDALRSGAVEFEGPSALTRRMPSVLRPSPIADRVASTR